MKIQRTAEGVWVMGEMGSVSRNIAIRAMISLGLDPNDFRQRDKAIIAIDPLVTDVIDTIVKNQNDRLVSERDEARGLWRGCYQYYKCNNPDLGRIMVKMHPWLEKKEKINEETET